MRGNRAGSEKFSTEGGIGHVCHVEKKYFISKRFQTLDSKKKDESLFFSIQCLIAVSGVCSTED